MSEPTTLPQPEVQPRWTCPRCQGSGEFPAGQTCGCCHGKGWTLRRLMGAPAYKSEVRR